MLLVRLGSAHLNPIPLPAILAFERGIEQCVASSRTEWESSR
jgi:hypothetical protein